MDRATVHAVGIRTGQGRGVVRQFRDFAADCRLVSDHYGFRAAMVAPCPRRVPLSPLAPLGVSLLGSLTVLAVALPQNEILEAASKKGKFDDYIVGKRRAPAAY